MTTIVQWNCRGLKANIDEIDILTQSLSPAAFCLQETMQPNHKPIQFRKFTQYLCTAVKTDGRPTGGVSIMINTSLPHSQITLNTPLQAVAARISLHRPITLCSIYLPPNTHFHLYELTDLVTQLPPPVLLMGDFNSHSPLWGCSSLDSKGKIIEDLINHTNLCLLNTKTSTYIHPATGSRTSIDLSICDPSLMLDLSWNVHDDLCGSDHFPIFVKINKPVCSFSVAKWKLHKTDWSTFGDLCENHLNSLNLPIALDPMTDFTSKLIQLAEKTIPKTKTNPKRISKPWFDETCKVAIERRKKSLKLFTTQPTPTNLDNFKINRAKTRRTLREVR